MNGHSKGLIETGGESEALGRVVDPAIPILIAQKVDVVGP